MRNFNTFGVLSGRQQKSMKNLIFWVLVSLTAASCTINKDILFKTPTDYSYDTLSDTLKPSSTISPSNILTFSFFTGNGHLLVEQGLGSSVLGGSGGIDRNYMNTRNQITYLVDEDGTAKLPVLGRVELAGMTVREAERQLEELYSVYYNDPFVILTVQNNRVIVSPGGGGSAQVITLNNNNTTVLEALAMAGGIDNRGDASEVKLIRKYRDSGERRVFKLDLSTIKGLDEADIIVQGGDILYVEPLPLIAREVVQEITPIVTLISTTALLITILNIQ